MTRFAKMIGLLGASSVTLMQLPCVNTGNGIAIPAIKALTGFISLNTILGT